MDLEPVLASALGATMTVTLEGALPKLTPVRGPPMHREFCPARPGLPERARLPELDPAVGVDDLDLAHRAEASVTPRTEVRGVAVNAASAPLVGGALGEDLSVMMPC